MVARVELYYIFAAYIAFVIGVAVYIFIQNKNKASTMGDGDMVSDHFLAGRQTPVILLMLTTFSTIFSGYTMIGVPDEAYEYGFVALKW
jgi:Na+/proline symporter